MERAAAQPDRAKDARGRFATAAPHDGRRPPSLLQLGSTNSVLTLQGAIGNRAVVRLIQRGAGDSKGVVLDAPKEYFDWTADDAGYSYRWATDTATDGLIEVFASPDTGEKGRVGYAAFRFENYGAASAP